MRERSNPELVQGWGMGSEAWWRGAPDHRRAWTGKRQGVTGLTG